MDCTVLLILLGERWMKPQASGLPLRRPWQFLPGKPAHYQWHALVVQVNSWSVHCRKDQLVAVAPSKSCNAIQSHLCRLDCLMEAKGSQSSNHVALYSRPAKTPPPMGVQTERRSRVGMKLLLLLLLPQWGQHVNKNSLCWSKIGHPANHTNTSEVIVT